MGGWLNGIERALILAPHPDDEVLGCGGTIARLADSGAAVTVAVATRGRPPSFDDALVERIRAEALEAHATLGVAATRFLDHPAAGLDQAPHAALNRDLAALVREVEPDALFLPFPGDIHLDHQLAHLSGMVAARPNPGPFPRLVLCYETLSETNWNAPYLTPAFAPNLFVDVAAALERKLGAMRRYASQLKEAPDERSLETIRALATLRGSTVRLEAAEAFVLVRGIA